MCTYKYDVAVMSYDAILLTGYMVNMLNVISTLCKLHLKLNIMECVMEWLIQ